MKLIEVASIRNRKHDGYMAGSIVVYWWQRYKWINPLRRASSNVIKGHKIKKETFFHAFWFHNSLSKNLPWGSNQIVLEGCMHKEIHCLVMYNGTASWRKCLVLRDWVNNLWHKQLMIKLHNLLKTYSWRLFKFISKCFWKVVK